jgi:hypothetical protein
MEFPISVDTQPGQQQFIKTSGCWRARIEVKARTRTLEMLYDRAGVLNPAFSSVWVRTEC